MSGDYAFVGVDVIAMASPTEAVLANQTVVVADGEITAVVPAGEAEVTGATLVIDGRGKYLIPGLSDMHVHYWPDDVEGVLFVAHGVTRVRNMHGEPAHLALKHRIAAGELLGPELRTTGPAVDGSPPYQPNMVVLETPAQAVAEVARQAAAGYEMIKAYSSLQPDVYAALVEAAERRGMPVVGHVPDAVGIEAAAPHQMSGEHLLLFDLAGNHAAQVAATVRNGMWSCPTLVAYDRVRRLDTLRLVGIEGDAYVDPALRAVWQGLLTQVDVPRAALARVVSDLDRAGGGLLVGTDANVAFLVPGWSMHDELELLVDAGLSPYDALRAATYNAAEIFGELDRSGTVGVGRDADLILLDRDPLEDIARIRAQAGVMVKGAWYPAEVLAAALEEVRRIRSQSLAPRE